jgi:small subunit ribosomal protein S16
LVGYGRILSHMLMIRLQRIGRKNDAAFRVLLTDSKNSTKSGRFKEILGSYNLKKGEVLFKQDRIAYWISKGAQVSDTIHNFLVHQKLIEGKKKNVLSKKSPTKARKELKKV